VLLGCLHDERERDSPDEDRSRSAGGPALGLGADTLTSDAITSAGGHAIVGLEVERRGSDAVEELDERDGQALFGFARRLGLSDEQADDAVQDVLLRMWTELRRGVAIGNPRAWSFRVIYRLAMDQHRLRRRLRLIGNAMAERASSQDNHSSFEDRLAVWSEVDRLPERQRHVLYLRYRADLAFDEIAQTLGITPSAARSHATQALARLRVRLETEREDS
jgi:RNA polymerase sigma factor (sigma-70 family)